MPGPVTIRDVARDAGVSVTTVSHILNNTPHRPVAEATRRKVLETVERLGYHANLNARRLALESSRLYGLILSEIANPFFADAVRTFEGAVRREGCDLLLAGTEYDPELAEIAARKMIENKVQGVTILTSKFDDRLVSALQEQRIPVARLGIGAPRPGVRQMLIDSSAALGQALDHLASLGHREIAFIGGPRDVPSAEIIRDQLEAALAGRRLHLGCRLECNYKTDGGWAAVRSLIGRRPSASAILCGNDLIALGAISALEQMGIDVPSQMSVVGHDDLLIARLARPPLTTIRVSSEEIGRLAFESLTELVRTPDSEGDPIRIPGQLVIRKSTAPAPVEAPSSPSLTG